MPKSLKYTLAFLALLNGLYGMVAIWQTLADPATDPQIARFLGVLILLAGGFLAYFYFRPHSPFAWLGLGALALLSLLVLQSFRASPDPLLVANLSGAKFMLPVWIILGGIALAVYQPKVLLAGFSLGLTALLLEVGVRVWLAAAGLSYVPAYVPDATIGWKLSPHLEFEWAGLDPACVEFRTQIRANSLGFWDEEHSPTPEKQFIAVLGDSYVMAREVPLAQQATRLLEAELGEGYEVLNFGVTGFSLGQYIPLYESYARPFAPQVVFILVSEIQMARTVTRENSLGIGGATDKTGYNLRPAFRLKENGELERFYPEDVEELQAALDALKNEAGEFEPEPLTRILEAYPDAKLWSSPYAWLITHSQGFSFLHRRLKTLYRQIYVSIAAQPYQATLSLAELDQAYNLSLQYAVILELASQVQADGGQVVLVDNSLQAALRSDLAGFAKQNQLGYVDLTAALQTAEAEGRRTTFPCDGHFNATGQKVFAQALADWLKNVRHSPF